MDLPIQSGLVTPGYSDNSMDNSMDSDGDDSLSPPSRAQLRKSNKPLLEKKRRARINKSLDQLKGLVLEALKKDSARYSKLEKADILEMTVKHLREIQRSQMSTAMNADPTVVNKFHTGFGECAQEVHRYLGSIDGLSTDVRMRLMQHLSSCIGRINHMSAAYPAHALFGVPCASSPGSLPGLSMRNSLPFGGLALTSDSPSLPVSPSSLYSPSSSSVSSAYSPETPYQPKPQLLRDYAARKRDHADLENIAPLKSSGVLAERTGSVINTGSRIETAQAGDRNNNSSIPPAKRQRTDFNQEVSRGHGHPGNMAFADPRHQHLFALVEDMKAEPVWRPW